MAESFSAAQHDLLAEILSRVPDRGDLLRAVEENALSRGQRDELCQIIAAEFAETGLDSSSEPTQRGIALEELLDVVNRPNLGA